MTLTKCPARAGLEVMFEARGGRFLLECQVGLELPRTIFCRVGIDVGTMLAQALSQIVGGTDVEMTGYGNGFKNVNIVHRWGRLVRLRSASTRRYCRTGPPTRRYGATLSPFERLTLIGVGESG